MKRNIALLFGVASLVLPGVLAQSVDTLISTDLSEPYAVAVDTNNVYYITDSANNRILKYTPDTGVRTNFAGATGGSGYADGPGYLARFSSPQGVVAARGGLVVTDSGSQGHFIRFIAMDGTVSTLAGGSRGFANGVGTNAQFNFPAGVAADAAGNIYVADLVNNAVRKLDSTNLVTTVATGFERPAAVAVGDDGRIYVADSGNHSIKVISTGGAVSLLAGSGSSFQSGSNDNLVATDARFKNPRGLLWVGGTTGLLVSDSDNHVLRRVFFNSSVGTNSVETLASTVSANLQTPNGLARDVNGDLLIVDLTANTLRRLVTTQPQKPVSDPVIGTVALLVDTQGNPSTLLSSVTSSIFNNDVVVAILAEAGTETFFTRDGSDPGSANGSTPPPYRNGMSAPPTSIIISSQANAAADVTIKAISTAAGRRSSGVVSARFQFQVANPAIIGNNPGAVNLECSTTNAVLYYTTDGNDPTLASTLYTLGTRINIVNGTNDVVLKVRGFKNGYDPSRVVAQTFVYNNVQNSSIGVVRDFTAGIGATLMVPVEVRLITNDVLKSLQFRLEVTPNGGAPALSTNQIKYQPLDPAVDFFAITPPSTNPPNITNVYSKGTASGMTFGYLGTNSAFSVVNAATVAMFAVQIPPTASEGQTYSIGVLFPSGTADAFEAPVVLSALEPRTITVSNISYTVGDSAQSKWYSAGEFGNGNLNNNDVNNAFYASLGIRVPYRGSDLFDAMDAYPEDLVGVPGGDLAIRQLDWQTIFDRSLRLDTNNWRRTRSAGGVKVVANSTLNLSPLLPAQEITATAASASVWHREATFSAGHVENAEPGQAVSVPVYLEVQPGYDVSGMQFLAGVVPEPGAPFISGLRFVPAAGVPGPSLSATLAGGVGCGWLVGSIQPGLVNKTQIGSLQFTLPASAKHGQGYLVRFFRVDGSTVKSDGKYADYNFDSLPGSVWVQTTIQRTPDAITDQWKERFFGSINNVFANAFADPDGDGRNNLQEFLAGTNPAKLRFQVLDADWRAAAEKFRLKWFGLAGKKYVVETAESLAGPWTVEAEFIFAQDEIKDFFAPKRHLKAQFYRVRAVE